MPCSSVLLHRHKTRASHRRHQPDGLSACRCSATFVAGVLMCAAMTPLPTAAAGTDPRMARCVRGDDLAARVQACSEIIGDARDRNIQIRARNARGLALCGITDRCGEAVLDFTAVVRLAPKVAGYWDNDARALRAAKRYDDALTASNTAIGLAPRLAFSYFGKARTLEEAGRYAEAIDVVAQAIALAPTIAWPWALKGKLLAEAKDFTAAYAAFGQALILDPTLASVFVLRADAELAEGRRSEAIADLERYPADAEQAGEVRGRLAALRALEESETAPTATKAAPVAATGDQKRVPGVRFATADEQRQFAAASVLKTIPCNFYSWTPLQACVQEYHTDNDPFPTGPNPKRWNDRLAAEAKTIVDQHPEVQWDKTKWLAAKSAEDDASEEAELDYHAEQRVSEERGSHDDQAEQASERDSGASEPAAPADTAEIASCNASWVLAYLKRASITPNLKLILALKGTPINEDAPISGVVQEWYDAANEHRSCTANLMISSPVGFGNQPTKVSYRLRYHIDRRLDGDRGSLATCDNCQ